MKKFFSSILICLLLVVSSVLLVSCGQEPQDSGEGDDIPLAQIVYTYQQSDPAFNGSQLILDPNDNTFDLQLYIQNDEFELEMYELRSETRYVASGTYTKSGDDYSLAISNFTEQEYNFGILTNEKIFNEIIPEENIQKYFQIFLNLNINERFASFVLMEEEQVVTLTAPGQTIETYEIVNTLQLIDPFLLLSYSPFGYDYFFEIGTSEYDAINAIAFYQMSPNGNLIEFIGYYFYDKVHSLTGVDFNTAGLYNAKLTLIGGNSINLKIRIGNSKETTKLVSNLFQPYYYVEKYSSIFDTTNDFYENYVYLMDAMFNVRDTIDLNDSSRITITGFDSSTVGKKFVTVTFTDDNVDPEQNLGTLTCKIFYEVFETSEPSVPVKFYSIGANYDVDYVVIEKGSQISSLASLTEYYLEYDTSHGAEAGIKVYFSEFGTNPDLEISGLNLAQAGLQTATITYKGVPANVLFIVYDIENPFDISVRFSNPSDSQLLMLDANDYDLSDYSISIKCVDGTFVDTSLTEIFKTPEFDPENIKQIYYDIEHAEADFNNQNFSNFYSYTQTFDVFGFTYEITLYIGFYSNV